jgi:hypothetical protein
MKRPVIITSSPRNPSPIDAELDRLLDLRLRGFLTLPEYVRDRNAVLARKAAEARV